MLNPLLNILSQVQTPQGGVGVQGGAQATGLGAAGLAATGANGSFVNLLGNVVSVIESAQTTTNGTDPGASLQASLLQTNISNEKLSEDTIAALYGAAVPPTPELAPLTPTAAATDALALDQNAAAASTTQVKVDAAALAQAATDTAVKNDLLTTSALNDQISQNQTVDTALAAAQVKADALADLTTDATQQKQTQLQDAISALQTLSTQNSETASAAVVAKAANDDDKTESLLDKALKLFNSNNSATHHDVDKSTVVRAAQAYSDANSDQSSYTPFKNDGTFGAVAANQAHASDASATNTQIAAPTAVGKVGEVSSEAAVAVKNPVPNFPSHNPTAAEQVSTRISHALRAGESEVSIKLEPAELGKVEVRLNLQHNDGKAMVSVVADEARTLDMLKTDSRSLERALNDAGIKTDAGSLSFNLRGDGSNFMARQDNNGFGNNNSPASQSNNSTINGTTSSGGTVTYVSDKALDIMV
ncbi:MAG: flagellar hook-length control protein FliK [Proteobacteria bacterium]|nr:flagellar hook-length control protein FliK [Pseudomonadota bacterium]